MIESAQSVLAGERPCAVVQSDAIEFMRALPEDSVDLVFGSPPYEQARLYLENGMNIGIARDTETWVAWMIDVFTEAQRVSRGLVAFVVEGQTRKYRYSCGPLLLAADLCRKGFNLRKPPIFARVGIPGSGGPDWLRNDYEFVICTTTPGKLPWSDNTACGHPPKWAPGGEMSHRISNGTRVNQWGTSFDKGGPTTSPDGQVKKNSRKPSHTMRTKSGMRNKEPRATEGDGEQQGYDPPTLANPGNIIKLNVGGGLMGGDRYSSQNEAPFPERLAEFFVLSFAPPGGLVLDCFGGSGTTPAVALRHGRRALACDLRASQVELIRKRLSEETPLALLPSDN